MSYQVGFACYADLLAAGQATCANFSPVFASTGGTKGTFTSTSCESANNLGVLHLKTVHTSYDGLIQSTTYSNLNPIYNPCLYSDYMDAALLILSALLSVWAAWWGYHQLYKMLHWSKADKNENY